MGYPSSFGLGWSRAGSVAAVGASLLLACGSTRLVGPPRAHGTTDAATTDGNGGSPGDGGSPTGGAPGAGGALVIGGGGAGTGEGGSSCLSIDTSSSVPVDMYVMFDQSSSMNTVVPNSNPPVTWWESVQQAFANFVNDPRVAATGVGLQFFPFRGLADPNNDASTPSSSCYVPNYVTPQVEVGPLPGNAGALIGSMQRHSPTTFRPTAAALTGAIQHMQAWGQAHPGRQSVVVLVTDGYPTECDPQDLSLIAQIAQQASRGTPRVLTFVIGLETSGGLDGLNQIGKAGGTGAAVLIGSGDDIGNQLVTGLIAVGRSNLSCEYQFPGNQLSPADFAKVGVQYVPTPTRVPQAVPRVDNDGQCASVMDGWYYDAPPPASTKILLCPQTCDKLGAGSIDIGVPCGLPPGP